MLASVSIS